jgi:hypothetical protein
MDHPLDIQLFMLLLLMVHEGEHSVYNWVPMIAKMWPQSWLCCAQELYRSALSTIVCDPIEANPLHAY